jgi:hypothetical protein
MSSDSNKTERSFEVLNSYQTMAKVIEAIRNKANVETDKFRLPIELGVTADGTAKRIEFLKSRNRQRFKKSKRRRIGPQYQRCTGQY